MKFIFQVYREELNLWYYIRDVGTRYSSKITSFSGSGEYSDVKPFSQVISDHIRYFLATEHYKFHMIRWIPKLDIKYNEKIGDGSLWELLPDATGNFDVDLEKFTRNIIKNDK